MNHQPKKINIEKLLAHPLVKDTVLSKLLWPDIKTTAAQSKLAKKKSGLNYNKFTEKDQERFNVVINQFFNDITED